MADVPQTTMFVFPGQGSQYKTMGSDIHAEYAVARRVYERASEVVGYDLAALSFEDPEERLDKTEFTQPALLTHSVACLEVFKDLSGGVVPDIVAGHSLGEYTALVAAGALTLESAVTLVRRRGQLMSQHGEGEMVAIPSDLETVRPIAERHYCGIGGCNLPNQTVVGGMAPDIDAFVKSITAEHPKLRPTRLRTEGAFHTYLMIRAAMEFRATLDATELREPACRILSNFTGDFYEPGTDSIKYKLFYQLFHPVRWIWSMQRALSAGVSVVYEFGGGVGSGATPAERRPNLAGIIQRTMRAREGRFGRRSDDVRALATEASYLPGINCATLRHAAHVARSLARVRLVEPDDGSRESAAGESSYHLHIPLRDRVPLASAFDCLAKVDELGLGAIVQIVAEPEERNLEILAQVTGEKQPAQPYLERVIGTSPGAPRYSIGAEIEEQLRALKPTPS